MTTPAFFLLASDNPLDHVVRHDVGEGPWFRLFDHDIYLTNSLLMLLVAATISVVAFPLVAARHRAMKVPRGFVNFVETFVQFIRDEVARPNLKQHAGRFLPYLCTTFFFILLCNLLGLVPLADIVELSSAALGREPVEHIGGTATAHIMVTAGLAITTFVVIHLSGVLQVFRDLRSGTRGHGHHGPAGEGDHGHSDDPGHAAAAGEGHGHGHAHAAGRGRDPVSALLLAPVLYIWNFAPHLFKPAQTRSAGDVGMWAVDVFMWLFFLPLEIVGALVKPFSLSVRLFANMVAGHIVIASILMMALLPKQPAICAPIAISSAVGAAGLSLLELFVAFLQAYIFTFLSAIFIGAAVAPEH
ncbi:MAG: F0F1 ATP synthase subunit A [Planctomycetes bacterium]|nr:F0F1 ATP synthase subunit A [Planctomycetota bacterium]